MELADFEKMESDPRHGSTRSSTTPKPPRRSSRTTASSASGPCFHDDYLDTFNRHNVELVDTNGQGVERITETGVVANGVEYEVDCIIFATGFEVGTSYQRRSGFQIHGADGQTLDEAWAGGIRTLHSMFVDGFPNLFIVQNAQGGFTAELPAQPRRDEPPLRLRDQSQARARGATRVEATRRGRGGTGLRRFASSRPGRSEFFEECTPGYYNNEGNGRTGVLHRRERPLRRRTHRVLFDPGKMACVGRAARPRLELESTAMASNAENAYESIKGNVGCPTTAPGDWFEVTQELINQFADVTHDHQFIHVDPERGEERPLRHDHRPWVPHPVAARAPARARSRAATSARRRTSTGLMAGVNYGFDKIRFINPGQGELEDPRQLGLQGHRAQGQRHQP